VSNNRKANLFKLGIVFVDIFIVLFSTYISYLLRYNFTLPMFNFQPFIDNAPSIIILYFIFMYVFGLLDELKQSLSEIIYSIFLTVIFLFIATMAMTFFMRAFSYPRTVLFISTVVQFLLLSLWRVSVWKLKRKIHGKKSVLIISDTNSDNMARKMLLKHNDIYSVKYICDSFSKNIESYIDTVDIIVLCDDLTSDFKNFIIDKGLIDQKTLFIVPVMSDMAFSGSKLNKIDDVAILELKPLRLSVEQKLVKRVLDIIVSGIMLVITSPVMLIVAVCIKITDMGPVFYKQERVTEGGKLFKVLKFRSMIHNAENKTGPVLASENDERITRVGKVIRASSTDKYLKR
jgi:Bacterial sugar transferase/CoA-binding domain